MGKLEMVEVRSQEGSLGFFFAWRTLVFLGDVSSLASDAATDSARFRALCAFPDIVFGNVPGLLPEVWSMFEGKRRGVNTQITLLAQISDADSFLYRFGQQHRLSDVI